MKKVLIFLVVLMTVPAMAVTVTVTATNNADCNATISYTTEEPNRIRGFGLDLSVDNGETITGIVVLDSDYRIYPGQIYVVDGNVVDYNTPYVAGSLPAAAVTVEMASLYTDDANYAGDPNYGYGMEPGFSGSLLLVSVSDDCNLSIAENAARGGIVLEDPEDAPDTVTLTGVAVTCGWPYPPCWDFLGQCHADTDNDLAVGLLDFYDFRDSWNKNLVSNPPAIPGSPAPGEYNACADTNRDGSVGLLDFYDFRDNWNASVVGDCPTGDLNEIYKP